MKKFILVVLLFLAAFFPVCAIEFEVEDCQILQTTSGNYKFCLTLFPSENESLYSGSFGLTLSPKGWVGTWASIGDDFFSIAENAYGILPISYVSNKTIVGELDSYPILLCTTTSEQKANNMNTFALVDNHQIEFLSALLSDGFVVFELYCLDTGKEEIKSYYWNIADDNQRSKALEMLNRYMDFFY